ncbi:hypothetical protein GGQ74_001634 [Desulfobaculum xiamenense]|uniref:DUF116 domain-containing protein n=1 Tax=Desulfobaculum xiamenense TaxID=995050 RepID=A0A846QIG2_9BACT|nr:DUF116 domain-containing protein [Desulfobaculum xiamenense]NJB67961.1 hypothetical protein [Desulfobaculum xiamenense]
MSDDSKRLAEFDALDITVLRERKRLFIGLITLASVLVCGLLFLLWYVPYIGLTTIHPLAPWLLGAVVVLAVCGVGWAALGLVLNILVGRSLPGARRLHGLTIKLFLPLMVLLGKALGISKRRVRSSFIKVNNELVLHEAGRYEARDILLLLPHCLQNSRCEMRLTYDINNCKRCGKCPIKALLELSEHYGVNMAIATGGTIARRIVVQTRPKLILAVACERDLASGIQDTYPIPTYGVMNERPHGPCLDTQVSTELVEKALRRFLATPPEPAVSHRPIKAHAQAGI